MQNDVFPVAPLPVAVDTVPEGAMEGGNALRRMQDSHGFATAIAVQRPRSLAEVDKRVQEEARLLGEQAYYGWGAGKDKIEGPTIKLAMVLARNWGNAAVDSLPVQETADAWIFSSAFIDLETGFTLTRQFRQAKTSVVAGRYDDARKDDMRFQNGQSRSARNVVVNALPVWLVDKAVATAKAGVRAGIEQYIKQHSIEDARKAILKALAKETVKEDRVLAKMRRQAVGGLTIDDLVVLRGDVAALQDGADSAESLFPKLEGELKGDFREQMTDPTRAPKNRGRPKKEPATEAAEAPPAEPAATEQEAVSKLINDIATLWHRIPLGQRGASLKNLGINAYTDIGEITDTSILCEIAGAFEGDAAPAKE